MFTDEPRFVSWKMLLTHVLDLLRRSIGGPRNAAKRASSRPLVPFRQLTFCHLELASMSSAALDRMSGMCRLRGTAPTGNRRPDQFYPGRIHLKVTKDTNGPGQAACREPLTERRADAVSGICQPAEANTGWDHAINLGQRDLWLASRYAMLDWNTGTLHPSPGCSSNSRNAIITGTSRRSHTIEKSLFFARRVTLGSSEIRFIVITVRCGPRRLKRPARLTPAPRPVGDRES